MAPRPQAAKQRDKQNFVTWAPPWLVPKPGSADILDTGGSFLLFLHSFLMDKKRRRLHWVVTQTLDFFVLKEFRLETYWIINSMKPVPLFDIRCLCILASMIPFALPVKFHSGKDSPPHFACLSPPTICEAPVTWGENFAQCFPPTFFFPRQVRTFKYHICIALD